MARTVNDLVTTVTPSNAVTPDDNLRLAALEATTTGLDPVPDTLGAVVGRGWAFDFATGQFARQGASPAVVSGENQLKSWIEKTLYTSRFAHPIYTSEYGTEGLVDIIGKLHEPGSEHTIEIAVRDALIVHDRITNVTDFSFAPVGESLEIGFTVVLDDGTTVPFSTG